MPTPHCPDNKIKRIKLRLDNIKNVVYPTYPITTGVPFADKELTYDAAIRIVTENGIALPAQKIGRAHV